MGEYLQRIKFHNTIEQDKGYGVSISWLFDEHGKCLTLLEIKSQYPNQVVFKLA
ncbi:MAG: hypothetical protein ICV63_18300 [Coleofasciculus sp. Co-bin14]|nr:hypothetical protein [Coleofasciculus sp. Co-bin14]